MTPDRRWGGCWTTTTQTAARADALLSRQTRPAPVPATTAPSAGSPAAPGLADAGQALAWARAERASLLACLDHATREHQHARVTALTAALAELLRRDGSYTDAVTRHATAPARRPRPRRPARPGQHPQRPRESRGG